MTSHGQSCLISGSRLNLIRRCVQFRAETGADQKQVKKLIEALLQKAGGGQPTEEITKTSTFAWTMPEN